MGALGPIAKAIESALPMDWSERDLLLLFQDAAIPARSGWVGDVTNGRAGNRAVAHRAVKACYGAEPWI
jgi:hypothetical protein